MTTSVVMILGSTPAETLNMYTGPAICECPLPALTRSASLTLDPACLL